MYDLGEQFKLNLEQSTANSDCIFKGDKYRITVLTERLVRLEYNEYGIFEDYPTELVMQRKFSKPEFEVTENNKHIKISTKYFELDYLKEKNFKGNKLSPSSNLKISLKDTNRVWYYKHPEARNYSTAILKNKDKVLFGKSLYSIDGFVSLDDSKSSIILENGLFKRRDNTGIDIYVFLYNKDFYYCLNDYFMLTGYPPLIPRYALGNWWSKNVVYDDNNIEKTVKKFEENNVPVSVFILKKWQENQNFEFNKEYKNPRFIANYLHSKNIKLGLSIKDVQSFSKNSSDNIKLNKYLAIDKDGNIPFNLYDAKTIDGFLKLLIHPLENIGVDFYSLDDYNKQNLERIKLLSYYLYKDSYRYMNKRPLLSTVNSTVAPHRYPVLYSGKSVVGWDSLKDILKFNVQASNLGISFWSHDFGGSTGGVEDSELFTRFIELGVFSPILRLNSDSSKYYKREPWKWGIETSTITTNYINLRYKLIPYIYTESFKYFKYGKPLIEPLYYKYPNLYDDILYCNEYYFGSSFLISPILNKKDVIMNRVIQKIYIPDGIWYDFFTGKKYTGNRRYVSFYKDEEYPVFVRAGTIIPMALNNGNDTSSPKTMEIQVFPGDNSTYSIYEDDGVTNNYLNGEYLITNVEFIYKKNDYKLTILPVSGKIGTIENYRNYKIRFKNTRIITNISVYVGNNKINYNKYKDETDLIIDIKDIPTNSQVTIICNGEDIEVDNLRIINDDIVSIISDLPIKTTLKEKIDSIMFSNEYDIKKKRIEIRKLAHAKEYLEKKYVELFLKLLEYIKEV